MIDSGCRHPRLTIIIVNYESWPDTLRLTAALAAEPEFQSGLCQVVVVDNASRGPIPAPLASPPPGFKLLARHDNGGFAVGVNAGWRVSRSPWLLVLNPDVEVDAGFLAQVLAKLAQYDADPDRPPGLVGFGLKNSDGSYQGSVGVFPSLARTIWEQFIPRSRRKYQAGWRIRSGPVQWVTGACMLINSAMITQLGGMDEDFFLYHEEVAFCKTAVALGWRVLYDPSITVVHRHPLQNRPISPKMRVITRHGKLLYFHKHLPRWQFLGLIGMVGFESAIRARWCRWQGHVVEARAWRAVGTLASELRSGVRRKGIQVLALAESVAGPDPCLNPGTGSQATCATELFVPASARPACSTRPLQQAGGPRGLTGHPPSQSPPE